jgi:hypothetical protein
VDRQTDRAPAREDECGHGRSGRARPRHLCKEKNTNRHRRRRRCRWLPRCAARGSSRPWRRRRPSRSNQIFCCSESEHGESGIDSNPSSDLTHGTGSESKRRVLAFWQADRSEEGGRRRGLGWSGLDLSSPPLSPLFCSLAGSQQEEEELGGAAACDCKERVANISFHFILWLVIMA